MSTRRSGPRASVTKTNAFSACLSPPLWKDQLRQRCLARLKQNRHELLVKLRSPNANIVDEMKRLVYKEERSTKGRQSSGARHLVFDELPLGDEQQTNDERDLVTIEDLMVTGQLSEQDYLDIVHTLEDELRNEWDADDEEERFAEEMIEFEEASLAAMLSGMGLDEHTEYDGLITTVPSTDDDYFEHTSTDCMDGIHVLCPVCKFGSLRESSDDASHSVVSCTCGFSLRVKNILHGALEDLQEKISAAFMAHREECHVDPTFAVFSDLDDDFEVTDSLLMSCCTCGHECLVR